MLLSGMYNNYTGGGNKFSMRRDKLRHLSHAVILYLVQIELYTFYSQRLIPALISDALLIMLVTFMSAWLLLVSHAEHI